jgi:hypothetical protein
MRMRMRMRAAVRRRRWRDAARHARRCLLRQWAHSSHCVRLSYSRTRARGGAAHERPDCHARSQACIASHARAHALARRSPAAHAFARIWLVR